MIYDLVGLACLFFFAGLLMKGFTILASVRLVVGGLLISIFMAYANSLVEQKWTIEYFLQFIALKKVGIWFFRVSAFMGYVFMLFGITNLLALFVKKAGHAFRRGRLSFLL